MLSVKQVAAQVPPPIVKCNQTENPEFHSLRPYQASPCVEEQEQIQIACGNDLIIQKKYNITSRIGAKSCTSHADGSFDCEFEFTDSSNIKISLPDAELPILGNTQLVKNSQNASSQLNPAQRVNEYVSWYLNGANYRAEETPVDASTSQGQKDLLSFAGPLRKLLPLAIVHQKQVETIKEEGVKQHDQIVVCAKKKYFFGLIGPAEPRECYKGNNTQANEEYRLSEWDADLSLLNSAWNAAGNMLEPFKLFLPDYPIDQIQNLIGNKWNKRYPPAPSDFENGLLYEKAYSEWRGKTCIVVPIVNRLACIDNPLITNEYADLFPYVPLSSAEDRIGSVDVNDALTIQPASNSINVTDVKFTPNSNETNENLIYVPHTEEVSGLSGLLQKTFAAQGVPETNSPQDEKGKLFVTDNHCDLNNVRWNSGDDLFGEVDTTPIQGKLDYKVSFSCNFGPPVLNPTCFSECRDNGGNIANCQAQCTGSSTCEKEVNVALSVYTNTPLMNDIGDRLVFGDASIVKRIYPFDLSRKSQLLGLPGVTTAKYESPDSNTTVLAGDPKNNRPGSRAEIFIPHLGAIQEYFLRGIQTALRPKGLAGSLLSGITSGNTSNEVDCNQNASASNVSGILSKDAYHDLALRWVGNKPGTNADKCYNDVISKARAAGVNVGLALWLWVHESDASNYNVSVEDFGVHYGQPKGFNAQINGFLSRAKIYNTSHSTCQGTGVTNDLQAFAYIYKSGKCDNSQEGAETFWQELRNQFNWVAPGCSLPSSATDTSCP